MDGSSSSSTRTSVRQYPQLHLGQSAAPHNNANTVEPPASSVEGSTRSPPSQRVLARKRRALDAVARYQSDLRTGTTPSLNGETSGAEPGLRTPSKRKASSSAKPGKPLQMSSTVVSPCGADFDLPTIETEAVFGASESVLGDSPILNGHDFFDSSDDEFDELDQDLLNPGRPQGSRRERPELQNSFLGGRRDEASKRGPASERLSALLVNTEETFWKAHSQSSDTSSLGQLRYLPLCPAPMAPGSFGAAKRSLLTVLPSHRGLTRCSGSAPDCSNAVWPLNELPVELFDLITAYLSRDDVKSMRLVDKEFERKVSRSLFHTCVVPFNTELYDMIDEDQRSNGRVSISREKGKRRMEATFQGPTGQSFAMGPAGLQWQNATEDKEGKVYKGHGLRVFQGFGPYIKHFGMSFEVSERQLSQTPTKQELDHVESYHGSYDWPSMQYARFPSLVGLENTADETSRMKAAFSNLKIVQELALSVDSGLGWLNGADRSIRATVFDRPSAVFGSSYDVADHATQAATEFWTALQQSQQSFAPDSNLKETILEYRPLPSPPAELAGLRGQAHSSTRSWPSVDPRKVLRSGCSTGGSGFGMLYTTQVQQNLGDAATYKSLVPGDLSKVQKEWLLETQWAQQAFLESYVLAIVDNPSVCEKITTLNIAKISSRFLPMLAREVFWDALPCLAQVTLHVSPDWRKVEKDDAGFAVTKDKSPSEAVRIFHGDILQERISSRQSIKRLDVGWIGGGEHAEGMFARNSNILPAPITQLRHCTADNSAFATVFEYVEHLTLTNCWITPPTLHGLITDHSTKALKKITLDSVSLTAHPRFPATGPVPQNFAQILAAMQAQLGNNPGLPPHPHQQHQALQHPANLVPNAQQVALLHLQMNQMLNNQPPQVMNAQLQQLANNPQFAAAAHHLGMPMHPMPPVGLPALPALNGNPASHWTDGHREGSWPDILNAISPGPVFGDYLSPRASWEEPLPTHPETSLQCIEFKSCGYARLQNHGGFDQLALEPNVRSRARVMSQWFRSRYDGLKPAMLSSLDRNLGQIVQFMPQRELDALQFAWGLTEGWEDRWKAEEVEFDGLLPGGTGRFSGIVKKDMALVGQSSASHAPVRSTV